MCVNENEKIPSYEYILSQACSRLAQADNETIDAALYDALRQIGTYAKADRAYIFCFHEDRHLMSNTHEWCADGIEPQIENLQSVNLQDELPWFAEEIQKGDPIYLPIVRDLPSERALERQHFERQGIQSLVVVPMKTADGVSGFIGFDSVSSSREWDDKERMLLQFMADTMAGALQRLEAEEQRRESEEKYHHLFDLSPDGIVILDSAQRRPVEFNETAHRQLGYTREEFSNLTLADIDVIENPEETAERVARVMSGELCEFDTKHRTKSGEIRDVHVTAQYRKAGSQMVYHCIWRDVTEQKQAKQSLEVNEERQARILKCANDGWRDWDFATDHFYYSDRWWEMLGYSPGELPADSDLWRRIMHPDDKERVEKYFRNALDTGLERYEIEFRLKHKNGAWLSILSKGIIFKNSDGSLRGVSGINIDLTEQKRAQAQLRLQSLVLNQIQDRVTVTDLTGVITFVNDATISALGCSRDELLGAPVEKYGEDPSRGATQQEIVEETLKQGTWRGEVVNRTADGREMIMDCRTQLVLDEYGDAVAMAGISTDITEQKNMELQLREREQRLSLALETARLGYWKWTQETDRVEWYGDHHKLFGIAHEDFEGTLDHVQRCVHPDDRQMGADNIQRAIEEHTAFDNTYRVIHPDGSIHWLNSYGYCYYDDGGNADSIFGITRDISDYKFALEAVEERVAQLTALLESMQRGVLVETIDRKVVFANQHFCDLFGIPSLEALRDADCAEAAVHSASLFVDSEGFLNGIDACLSEGKPVVQERFDMHDGRILERTYAPVMMHNRRFGHLWLYRDKTEQVRMEQEIVSAKEEWERTFDAIPDLVSIVDNEHKIVRANQALARKLGTSVNDLIGRTCYDLVHNLDAPPEFCPHSKTLCDFKEHVVEVNEPNLGGDYQVTTTPLARPDGTILGSVHVARDISEHKRLEKEASDRAEYIRKVLDSTDAQMAVVGANGIIHDVNAAWREFALNNGAPEDEREWGVGASYTCCPIQDSEDQSLADRAYTGLKGVQDGILADFEMEYPCHSPSEQRWFTMRILPLKGAPGAVLVSHTNITSRVLAENALAKSDELNRAIIAAIPDILFVIDRDGFFMDCHAPAPEYLLYAPEDIIGQNIDALLPPDLLKITQENLGATLRDQTAHDYRYSLSQGGETREYEARMVPAGKQAVLSIVRDVTPLVRAEEERVTLERQLQHTQKLESLGVLAGGIAHDFNNLLMSILGYADMALEELSPTAPGRENIDQIEKASRRAADLCAQLLAYSGKGRFVIEPFDLNQMIAEMTHLLKASISKKATLNFRPDKSLSWIEGDATQVRQVIMNLVINASEAIGDSDGVISISTSMTAFTPKVLQNTYYDDDVSAGSYVCLEVMDTGCGMEQTTIDRLFEPFFTTKFTGRGLGMSAVLGIVQGHKGVLMVESQIGRGTTFRILFPPSLAELKDNPLKKSAQPSLDKPSGRILLVDDEESIRVLGQRMLKRIGFDVITAADGKEALNIYQQQKESIDLVMLDLTMPHMDGKETLRELSRLDPQVRVVMASGYSNFEIESSLESNVLFGVIQKPYTMKQLREYLYPLFEK